jgi:pimeloyl-ACP methyl ester carboxylesterase
MEDRGGYTDFLGHTQPSGTATLSRLASPVDLNGLPARKRLDPAVLGTSQLEGCPGDFCQFDLSFIENQEVSSSSNGVDMGHNRTDLSDFRKRLLATNTAGVDDVDEMASLASSGAFQAGSDIGSHHKNTAKETRHIPFRIIVQARQEMPLVNRLMRKIRRGDDGRNSQLTADQRMELEMYVTEDNYNDLAISSKLPSHYYRDVACCETCFKVYKIITDARAAAIKYIEKKKDKSKKKKLGVDRNMMGGSSYDLNSVSENYGGGENLEQSLNSREVDKLQSLHAALQAIESLTKLDVAEIRTMSKPPAAVEVVMEAVMVLLTGKVLSFQECRRLLGGGEAFLLMLREFQLENVTDARLKLVEPYVDNPVFRPENVLPISFCASKFCAWVLGVVQAARWQRGQGHKRSNLLPADSSYSPEKRGRPASRHEIAPYEPSSSAEEMTFQEKLERKKARRGKKVGDSAQQPRKGKNIVDMTSSVEGSGSTVAMFAEFNKKPKPSHNYISRSLDGAATKQRESAPAPPSAVQKSKETKRREQVAMVASQKRSVDRLSSLTQEGHTSATGIAKEFRCYDGITKMSYIVLGNVSLDVSRVNFIVVHDFFDTCDATAITFKPIVQRHDGCQVFCWNYPGQANTVWPRPSAAERERGASEQILNNDWIADRLHELLQHAEGEGDILLTNPFHLVGIGNGAAIAAAFALKYGSESLYASSLRSVVSINGVLYPDPQLSSILHSASQVFESSPHSRPDIPISYWSRFVFSEDYLSRINPNLALNIYTAVSNPITNDGRTKIARGCLKHKDMRGMLNPDALPKKEKTGDESDSDDESEIQMRPVSVPVIILQSTENMLVNASNVDGFLGGRVVKHLWSHQQNVVTPEALVTASDFNATWVGKLCNGPADYAKFSLLGRTGLKMLLDCMENPRGAFVMWTRAGHAIQQENKTAVLDLLDALACPMEGYYGLTKPKEKPSTDYMTNIIEMELKKSKPVNAKKAQDSDDELDFGVDDNSDINEARDDDGENSGDDEMVLFEIQGHENPSRPVRSPSPEPSPRVEELGDDDDERKDGDAPVDEEPADASKEQDSQSRHVSFEPAGASFTPPPAAEDKDNEKDTDTTSANKADDDDDNTPIEKLAAPAPNVRRPEELRSEPTVIKKDTNQPDLPKTTTHVGEHQTAVAQTKKPLPNPVEELIEESTSSELKVNLDKKVQATVDGNEAVKKKKAEDEEARLRRIEEDQALRRVQFQKEDDKLLAKLDSELDERRKEREKAERLRRLELQNIEQKLIDRGIVDEYEAKPGEPSIIKELPDMKYNSPAELPAVFNESKDTVSQLDRMIADEEDARKKGIMSMEQYDQVKSQMIVAQINRDQKTRHMEAEEQTQFLDDCARLIQRIMRGHVGRIKAARAAKDRQLKKTIEKGVKVFQAVVRGMIGRRRALELRRIHLANLLRGDSIINIQRIIRGFVARKYYRRLRRFVSARNIQRTFRGHVGRMTAERERQRLMILRRKEKAATKIESTWRMKVAKEEFRSLRIQMLAAIEIQRWYRGYLGRKIMARRREWESATPGPERIKLGLRMIEESKVAFERQQEEIDALHRAQERAEARVSHIHAELKESEKELVILERELQEIDQIERDLQIMTHERDVLTSEIKDAAGMPRSALPGHENAVMGLEPGLNEESSDSIRRKKAEAYALELTIQIKRAEREKKRQELETEFASVFQEVEKKRKALERLESSLADMESTRERKDREFRRLQKNLMQLLLEQKQELDDLREKGIELETATATTAAAATATAQKAKEHEKRSTAMFSQTEELMKFQFMSMSLSYFSSLNMLKQLRDMNSDTTSAAVTSSADAAAAAAAAATAANLPSMKKLNLGADDFVSLNIQKKKLELEVSINH